jgi:predicted TPR repeat methyltransferase
MAKLVQEEAVVTKHHGLENTPEQLLARAYALRGDDPDETLKLYADWAETYDQTMLDGLSYRSPQRIATLAAEAVARRDVWALDVGCGTGLLANSLRTEGFNRVDGLDYSAPMLAVAQREGRIDKAFLRDLNERLDMGTECYDMLVSTGTFTHGHVGAGCLPELLALLVPGGRLICTVHRDVWDEGGFGTVLQALTQARIAVVRSREADRLFADDDEPSGWYMVVEKLFY